MPCPCAESMRARDGSASVSNDRIVQSAQFQVNLAEIVESRAIKRGMTNSPLHVEGPPQIGKSHLRAIYQVLDLGKIMRGLRLAYPVALITTDVKRLPRRSMPSRRCLRPSASPRLLSTTPRRGGYVHPDAVQRDVVRRHQSVQLPRRLKTLNRGADSRQATSCMPACGCLADRSDRFPRSLSYQPKASWTSAKPGRGSSACAAPTAGYIDAVRQPGGGVGGAHVPGEQADDRGVAFCRDRSAAARSAA